MAKLDVRTAAHELGVSIPMIRVLIRRGELATYRVGRRVVIDPADLDDYLRRCRVPARAEAASSASGR